MIDQHALVDPTAQVDPSVTVGPFSIIGPDVTIGAGTVIGPHVVIRGPTTIGCDNHIYQFCSIGEDPQDKKYDHEITRLIIGDRNIIREYCTMHRGTVQDNSETRIGDDNLFMAYTHVAHDCVIGNHVIMANGASLAGHVKLNNYSTLGGFSLVHQFTQIGEYSFSAMGSSISRDIPPYVMVGGRPTQPHGINSVGLERKGFTTEAIRQIRKAYKLIYKSNLTLEQAVQAMKEMADGSPEVKCLLDFIAQSERGLIR